MEGNMESKLDAREQNDVSHKNTFLNSDSKFDYGKGNKKVQLVGVVNVTPDSFYDQGRYFNQQSAIDHGKKLLDQGADWLDVGGESTRPFATSVSEDEELRRVMPVIEALTPIARVSIDTRKAKVARLAVDAGVAMINDVSGFTDPYMCEVAAQSKVACCIMHTLGTPETMQINPYYELGVINSITTFFKNRIDHLTSLGIDRERLILDPGIGFGKTVDHCFAILRHVKDFFSIDIPLYLGLSRKSFLQKTFDKSADELLPATLICATVCALAGVSYLRVHDVEEHVQMLRLLEQLTC